MGALARYIVLIARRDRLFHGMLIAMIALSYISYVLGHTALSEEAQTAITLAAGTLRLMLMFGLMVFVCFHIHSAFECRELDTQLARPIARHTVVLGYFAGFAVIACALIVAAGILLAVMQPAHWQGYGAFMLSLLAESLLAIAFAMFAAFTMKSGVVAVLCASGFYVLSRLMGFFIIILTNHVSLGNATLNMLASGVVKLVALITPRLDFFAKTQWLHYGISNHEWLLFVAQTFIFIPLVLCAAMLDLRRKAF